MTCVLPFNARQSVISLTKPAADSVFLGVNWSDVVGPATIVTSAWEVFPTAEASVSTPGAIAEKRVSTQVSGGNPGQVYEITNTITASSGETLSQKIQLYIDHVPTIFVYTPCPNS